MRTILIVPYIFGVCLPMNSIVALFTARKGEKSERWAQAYAMPKQSVCGVLLH